jgi:hypothetical protein
MREEYQHLDQREALKLENEVMKMKLMLEHGAEIRYGENADSISAETEHEFLNYIMDFERQEALAKETTVFEVLGSPQHYRDEDEVGDDEIRGLLQDLLSFMKSRNIELTVFSPNAKPREIYRFVTRELFHHRMLHMNMPGMVTCFIYDEFHPDHPYENSRTAVNECLKEIFQDGELQWTFQYEQSLTLNQHKGLGIEQFRELVNRFKRSYEHIEPLCFEAKDCSIVERLCEVRGRYEVCLTSLDEHLLKTGEWLVRFHYWEEMDIWMIFEVQIDGMDFV